MKASLRILTLVLMFSISASSISHAAATHKGPNRPKSKKRSEETSFYSKQIYQAKYSKCPRFSRAKK
jgi:hypothetical protein